MAGLSLKKFLPQTLFGRSMLIIVTPVLLFQIIVTHVFFDRHWSSMTGRLSFALVGEISMATAKIEAMRSDDEIIGIIDDASKYLDLMITFEKGAKLEKTYKRDWKPGVYNEFAAVFEAKLDRKFIIRAHEKAKWYEIKVEAKNGVIRILCPERRLYSSTTYIFFLWMIGSAFVLFATAILFMRNQIRPIRRLADAAERFGKGRDFPTIRPAGASEIRQATMAFLEMKNRIKRQVEQRTAMLSGVSHDLRTPITRMKLQLEMLPHNSDTDSLRADLSEMEKMIEGYLTFIRGEGDEPNESVDLNKTVEKLASDYRRQGYAVSETLLPEPLLISVRPNAMERAWSNLVANACKYGKNVWISIYRLEDYIEFTVDDDGPGIDKGSFDDVFKPFFRIEQSRNRKTGGMGLGLSIAQDIVLSHGGKIWLETSNRGGLRVVVRIPV